MEDPVVPLERNLYGHPLTGLFWERHFEKVLLKYVWEKVPNWECLFVNREKGLLLSVSVDDIKLAGKKQNIGPTWKILMKDVDLGEPTSFLDHVYLCCTQRGCQISKDIVDNYRSMFESRISAGATEKLPATRATGKPDAETISSWSYDMEGHAMKCVERCCELANKTTEQLYKVATPCMDDHQFKEEENGPVGELSTVCSQIVVKCLYLASIGRLDTLWSVNKFARAVTKWTKACDKRLALLIAYIHNTCEYRQYCYVGNTAQHCRLGLFQDSDFAGDLEDSISTSGGILCIFGNQTFVPISWMCKKQTSVSHSSTEAEMISLDADLRMDGIRALHLWDLVIEVFHSSPNQTNKTKHVKEPRGNLSATLQSNMRKPIPTTNTNPDLTNIDHVPSSGTHSGSNTMLYVFEDNEAVIKMIIKGRSHPMRHVSRTHRVALDWLFDRINLDSKIQIRYIDTKHQLADILTKGTVTCDEWNNQLHFLNISHFSSTCCAENSSFISCLNTMAKRMQEQKRRRKKCGKIENYSDDSVFSCSDKFLICKKSDSVQKSGDTHSSGETRKENERKLRIRRSVEFSSATERCITWRVKGHSHGETWEDQKLKKTEWSHNPRVSPATIHHTEAVFSIVRGIYGREHDDPMNDLDVNMAIWGIFLNNTHRAAIHLGQDCEANLRHVQNILWNSIGQLFHENGKLTCDQNEITGIRTIDFQDATWMSTSLLCEKAYQITNAKTYVFSDSVLYVGKMGDDPTANRKRQIQWYSEKQSLQRDESNRWNADGLRVGNILRNHSVGPPRKDSKTTDRSTV